MAAGWQSPWPLEWGGSPTLVTSVLSAMRAMVGKGHAANADGVDWRWREARALGLAVLSTHAERALYQFEPRTATDALPFYRELYRQPEDIANEQARRVADSLMRDSADVDIPSLERRLQNIDPRFSILERPWEQCGTTVHGRAFQDSGDAIPFNLAREETLYPNFSHAFELVVEYDLGTSPDFSTPAALPTTLVERTRLATAKSMLDDALPAWCTYSIIGSVGFYLDYSPLDWAGFD